MKISYKKILTNIDWGFYLEFETKEELDADRVFTILWNTQSKHQPLTIGGEAAKSNVAATASAPNSGDRLEPTEGHAPSAHTGWNVCSDRGSWGVTAEVPPTTTQPTI